MSMHGETWARKEATLLAEALRARGVPVSIELQPGAGGSHWGIDTFVAVMMHHTVSRRQQGNTPCLALVKRGRPDVPGPLCNLYLGFDGVARIITMGRANHPGAGGPFTLDGVTIPRNQGRYYTMGWEVEGGLSEADWPPEFHELMDNCILGTQDYIRLRRKETTTAAYLEHSTWAPSRKIDRLGYTRSKGLARLTTKNAAHKAAATTKKTHKEEDMQLKAFLFAGHSADGKRHLYCAFPASRTVEHMGSPTQIANVRHVLYRQGYSLEEWGSEVEDTSAFGTYVGPAEARPKGAR